jgi:hypothetical protein
MSRIASAEQLITLEPKAGAKPRVYYKNNHLFSTVFVGGTIVTQIDGDEECVEGASITILRGHELLGSTSSDAFGEFKVGRLEPGPDALTLNIEIEGTLAKTVSVDLLDSIYIGCVNV